MLVVVSNHLAKPWPTNMIRLEETRLILVQEVHAHRSLLPK
jgi:hypothetical protein